MQGHAGCRGTTRLQRPPLSSTGPVLRRSGNTAVHLSILNFFEQKNVAYFPSSPRTERAGGHREVGEGLGEASCPWRRPAGLPGLSRHSQGGGCSRGRPGRRGSARGCPVLPRQSAEGSEPAPLSRPRAALQARPLPAAAPPPACAPQADAVGKREPQFLRSPRGPSTATALPTPSTPAVAQVPASRGKEETGPRGCPALTGPRLVLSAPASALSSPTGRKRPFGGTGDGGEQPAAPAALLGSLVSHS